eukprot:m51a1_g4187 putative D-amino-acid transaminase (291) ;mRNA; f:381394-382423
MASPSYVCWKDGRAMPEAEATVPVSDLTVLRGYGIFDYFRTYNGLPLTIDRNIQRLFRSAQLVGLSLRHTGHQLRAACLEVLAANRSLHADVAEWGLRLVVTGGVSPDNISAPPTLCGSTVILARPSVGPSPSALASGVDVITIPEAKHLNYLPSVMGVTRAKAAGAAEALFVGSDGSVSEGCVSNVFVVDGSGVLATPRERILLGINRGTVIQLAEGAGIRVEQREVALAELLGAAEVFLTSSNKQVLPVRAVDGKPVGSGCPGPTTRRLMALFREAMYGDEARRHFAL